MKLFIQQTLFGAAVVLCFFIPLSALLDSLIDRLWKKPIPDPLWIGHPFTSDADPYTPSNGYLTVIEFGLRHDGVVIWRQVPRKLRSDEKP